MTRPPPAATCRGTSHAPGPHAPGWLCLLAATCLSLVAQGAFAQAPAEVDRVPRDPLETRALLAPREVLASLPARLASTHDARQRALLQLARANACRVLADWNCQRDAGIAALAAAESAKDSALQVRGLVSEARGRISLQDFSHAERLLGEAERRLQAHPFPELEADVMLAYSAFNFTLGRNDAAARSALRGLQLLGDRPATAVRVRLMRNRANALGQLGRIDAAQAQLREALALMPRLADPKLDAELQLEAARLAHRQGDVATQRTSGERILALSTLLSHSQLGGLAHEVLGLAAMDAGDAALAERELRESATAFHALGLDRDERRVLRALVSAQLAPAAGPAATGLPGALARETARLVHLETVLDAGEGQLAGDELDARLAYARQEAALQGLQASATLTRQREQSLSMQRRLALVAAALGIGLAALAAAFFLSQRRLNRNLHAAIDRLHDSERELGANEAQLRAITDNMPAMISRVDREGRYRFVNAAAQRVLARPTGEILGRHMREVRSEEAYAALRPRIEGALRGERQSFEGTAQVGDRRMHYQSNFIPDMDEHGGVRGFYTLSFDISPLKEAEAALDRLSRVDSLTGVANRRDFEDRMEAALDRCRRQHEGIALLCLDLDDFKAINDAHGHGVGDAVIQAFADRLRETIREDDLVARLGGDEFMVLLENPAPGAGAIVAGKILKAMQEPMLLGQLLLQVRASIGVAECSRAPQAAALMALADRALYAAKAAGRNAFRAYSDDPARLRVPD